MAESHPVYGVLRALEGVSGNSVDGWTAPCPVDHDDAGRLSITKGAGHEIVLECSAGCSREAILEPLKVAPVPARAGETEEAATAPPRGIRPSGYVSFDSLLGDAVNGADGPVDAVRAVVRAVQRLPEVTTADEGALRWAAEQALQSFLPAPGAAKAAAWVAVDLVAQTDDRNSSGARDATEPTSSGPRIELRTLRELIQDPTILEPPEPLADRIAYRGYVTLLASREKLGKSTLATAVAAAVSSGGNWLGSLVTSGRVLYLTLDEAARDTARRLLAFRAGQEDVVLLTRLVTPGDPLGDLTTALTEVKPDLVVIDTLAEFVSNLGLDSGDAGAWTPVIGGIARLARDHSAAIVLLHHTKKDGEDYRDSTAIGASVDLILIMRERKEDASTRSVAVKGRLPLDAYSLRLQGDPHDLDGLPRWELASGELSLDARILLHVERHPGASTRDVREGVTGRNGDIDGALSRLLDRGALVDRGSGPGRSLYATDAVPQGPLNGGLGHTSGHTPVPEENPHGHATGTGGARSGAQSVPHIGPPGGSDGAHSPLVDDLFESLETER